MSDCVTLPPQPVKARYATRSEPTAREGSAAQYAGGPSTIVAGPKYGAAGAPPGRGPGRPNRGRPRRGGIAPPITMSVARSTNSGTRTLLLRSWGVTRGAAELLTRW